MSCESVIAVEQSAQAAASRCAVCGDRGKRVFLVDSHWIRECQTCAHHFVELERTDTHVRQIFSDEYFTSGGGGYSGYLSEERFFTARGRTYEKLLGRHAPKGRVLDIGAAAGFFVKVLSDEGWQAEGIEPNATMAAYAAERLGVSVRIGSVEDYNGQRNFDVVTMLQVIPHFVDPRAAVKKITTLLKPQGYLLIESWDRNSRTSKFFGRSWHEYNPPSVLQMFSMQGLVRMVQDCGFNLVAQGRPRRWISAAHAKSLLRHKATLSSTYRILLAGLSAFPDRTAIPYLGDDLVWVLFRRA